MSARTRVRETDLSAEEKARMADEDNSIWLNAMACIRPSDGFLISVGRQVVERLDDSSVVGYMPEPMDVEIGKVVYLRVRKS